MDQEKAEQIEKKLDQVVASVAQMRENQGELFADLKSIFRQLPGEDALQTQKQCEGQQTRLRWVLGGLAAGFSVALLTLTGWVWYLATKIPHNTGG